MPGPDVDVIARAPAQPAPTTMPMRGDLVLGLDDRERRLAGLLVHAVLPHVADERLGQRRRRRDRIPGDDRDAGEHAAHAPRRRCLRPGSGRPVLFIRSTRYGSRFGRCSAAYFVARLERAHVELPSPSASCRAACASAFSISPRSIDEQLREHAVVDHVLDEAAQLRVRADLGDDLVERHRIEIEVVAQRVELQRLVVDARRGRARATARRPSPSPRSSRRGSRFPSCG